MKKAYYRGIPIYYNPCNEDIKGRNWFYDILVDIMLWLDVNILFMFNHDDGFRIWMEIDDKDQEILGMKKKEKEESK